MKSFMIPLVAAMAAVALAATWYGVGTAAPLQAEDKAKVNDKPFPVEFDGKAGNNPLSAEKNVVTATGTVNVPGATAITVEFCQIVSYNNVGGNSRTVAAEVETKDGKTTWKAVMKNVEIVTNDEQLFYVTVKFRTAAGETQLTRSKDARFVYVLR